MITKLVKHGSGFALFIPKALREILKIEPEAPLEVSTDGKTLVVRPVIRYATEGEFTSVVRHINKKHSKVFERLAEL